MGEMVIYDHMKSCTIFFTFGYKKTLSVDIFLIYRKNREKRRREIEGVKFNIITKDPMITITLLVKRVVLKEFVGIVLIGSYKHFIRDITMKISLSRNLNCLSCHQLQS